MARGGRILEDPARASASARGVVGQAPGAIVVSHPSVVPINQSVYNMVADCGWSIDLVVPNRWKHEYSDGDFRPAPLVPLRARFRPLPVALAGQVQRHFYDPRAVCDALGASRPSVAFIEEESFSVPAFQWGRACWRRGIPFGVQADENLDRPLPLPARVMRSWTLRHASFVAARSPKAKKMVERWGARGRVEVIAHAVPRWPAPHPREEPQPFTVGFAGRFVAEKGLGDLVAAVHRLAGHNRLLLAGSGPLRDELNSASDTDLDVEIISGLRHEEMTKAYGQMDVLVLPSRTTKTWAEQFGRVLVEALWCGVPVVGSDSGEIPWVIRATGGGVVFPEGDVDALTGTLESLRARPALRQDLARRGRAAVERLFSVEAVGKLLDSVLREVSGTGSVTSGWDRLDGQNHTRKLEDND